MSGSHIKQMLCIFAEAGIKYKIMPAKQLSEYASCGGQIPDEADDSIIIEAKRPHEKTSVVGYEGFYTIYYFNETGSLIGIGIWE